jgi:hypothetical protein
MKSGYLTVVGVAAVTVALAGCGKPENSAYTQSAQNDQVALTTPLPAAPAWAGEVLGKPVSSVVRGATTCKGAVDVTDRHNSKVAPGDEIQGWAWDVQGKSAPARLLLTDGSAKVIGAGVVNRNRPDVPKALPEVKTPMVGWTVVTRSTSGVANVVGVSASGALCTIGSAQLS